MPGSRYQDEEIWRTAATMLQSNEHPAIHLLRERLGGGSTARIQAVMRQFWAEAGRQMLVALETGEAGLMLNAASTPAPAAADSNPAVVASLQALLERYATRLEQFDSQARGKDGSPPPSPSSDVSELTPAPKSVAAPPSQAAASTTDESELVSALRAENEALQRRVDSLDSAYDRLQMDYDILANQGAKKGGATPPRTQADDGAQFEDTGAPAETEQADPHGVDFVSADESVFGSDFTGPATFRRRSLPGRH